MKVGKNKQVRFSDLSIDLKVLVIFGWISFLWAVFVFGYGVALALEAI